MGIEYFLNQHGVDYLVVRDGIPHTLRGLPSTREKNCIKFLPDSDINIGDELVNPAGERLFVIDVRTVFGGASHISAYCQTEHDRTSQQQVSNVFHIGNAYNSVIGTDNTSTFNFGVSLCELEALAASKGGADREDIQQIISLLKEVLCENRTPEKGMLSKFSNLMERHSWLSSSLASLVLQWLTSL